MLHTNSNNNIKIDTQLFPHEYNERLHRATDSQPAAKCSARGNSAGSMAAVEVVMACMFL